MAEKKNQHFVPKVHLKKFASDDKKKQISIWLPKQDRVILGASIRDQCSKSYFYGKDMKIEEFFNSPEGMFGKIVDHLTEPQEVDSETLRGLLFLWLLQHLRTEKMAKEHMQVMSAMRDKITLGQDDNDELNEWFGAPVALPEVVEMTLDSAKHFFDVISDLRCVLLVNRSKTDLVMSDNPAVSSNKLMLMRYMKYRNWGIGSAGLYVYMPLTPRLGFLAFDSYVYELTGRNGKTCALKEKDAIALNQLVYLLSNSLIVLPPLGDTKKIVESLKEVNSAKSECTTRVNVAVETEEQNIEESKGYSVVSDEEFKNSKMDSIIHLESVPPIVPQHLPKLLIKQRPKFIDTKSGAGLTRYRGNQKI